MRPRPAPAKAAGGWRALLLVVDMYFVTGSILASFEDAFERFRVFVIFMSWSMFERLHRKDARLHLSLRRFMSTAQ